MRRTDRWSLPHGLHSLVPRQQENERMPRFRAAQLALAVLPLGLLAACAGGSSVQTLNDRMSARLSPEIQTGQVSVQPLADGTQVTIQDGILFAPGSGLLAPQGQRELTYVTQALLQPAMLTVTTTNNADSLAGARAAAVQQFFTDHLLPPAPMPTYLPANTVGMTQQGSAVTITVQPGWQPPDPLLSPGAGSESAPAAPAPVAVAPMPASAGAPPVTATPLTPPAT
jgi:hypothetical protein